MKRFNIPNAEDYLTTIQNEIPQVRDVRYFHRLEVVRFVLKGSNPYVAAQVFNQPVRAIYYWLHRLLDQGVSGLQEPSRPGRPPSLSQADQQRLQQDLRLSPRELGYEQNLWDGVLLSHHLAQRYQVNLGVRRCQMLFQEWGFSLQRPRQQASEAVPENQGLFKKIRSVNARP